MQSNMLVYISGPMTGVLNYNYEQFQRAEEAIKDAGACPFNPHKKGMDRSESFARHMEQDIRDLLKCDAICFLPNWHLSRGALTEAHVAAITGKEIYYFAEKSDPTKTEILQYPMNLATISASMHALYYSRTSLSFETPVMQIFLGGKKHSGKSTVAKRLSELCGSPLDRFAGPLKKGIEALGFEADGPNKNVQLLQYLGTDLVRENNPDHWVNLLSNRHPQINQTGLIVDDARFENEVSFGKHQRYGFTAYLDVPIQIRAERRANMATEYYTTVNQALNELQLAERHASEAIDPSLFDVVIDCGSRPVESIVSQIYADYKAHLTTKGLLPR